MELKLTQSKVVLIDDEDFDLISRYTWCAHKNGYVYYAETQIKVGNKKYTLKMHRLIMSAKKGQEVDHKNGNGLDNRRENLRFCTRSENLSNRRGWGSSKYKGVCWEKGVKKWVAYYYNSEGLKTFVGRFDSEEVAHEKLKEIRGGD
jgi:hypothetical protein